MAKIKILHIYFSLLNFTQFKHNVNIIYQKILFRIQHWKEINQEINDFILN